METDTKTTRWQDGGNLLLGLWLFGSPWFMGYAEDLPGAAWNAWILGAAIMLFAAVAVYMPKVWEEGLNMVLGIWLVISPWLLGFAGNREVTTNAVIIGALVTILALWAMSGDRDFKKWLHDHRPAT